MTPNKRLLLLACAALALGAIGWTLTQEIDPQGSKTIVTHSFAANIPPEATTTDIVNYQLNLATGSNLPTSITGNVDEGQVTATITGVVIKPTNERQATVSILDQQNDVVAARAYMNGVLVGTATVANGGIIVRSGFGLATLSLLLPPTGTVYHVEVQWDSSADGQTRSRSVQAAE